MAVENIQIPLVGELRFPRGVVRKRAEAAGMDARRLQTENEDLKKKLDDALKPKAPAEDPKADVAPKA
jgi:hypothetical protein